VPSPGAGNRLTPREYQTRWVGDYDQQLALVKPEGGGGGGDCLSGGAIGALADGYASPGPGECSPLHPSSPHYDYPAWDWGIPTGTPIHAVRGGRVATVQYWPHNWWDYGRGTDSNGCSTCGIGVTIQDNARWAHCHGNAINVRVGDTVEAGMQTLTSGTTGRSSGPHLHLQIRTPDSALRCPQHLLRSLRDRAVGVDLWSLPTVGCSY